MPLCSVVFLASAVAFAQDGAPVPVSPQTHLIIIKDYLYQPATLSIAVGDTVQWRNEEKRTSHSVLFLERDIPESERLFPDESWQMTFTEAGAFPYRCGPHPEMRGLIHVGETTSPNNFDLLPSTSFPEQTPQK